MNCEEYEILLSARLDGALTPEETARLEAHLAQCPQCRQLAQELETLQAQTAALTQEVPRALQENLEGRDWSRVPQTGTAPSKKKKRLLPWAACAAAAVVLMVFGFTHLALPGAAAACPRASPPFSPCRGTGRRAPPPPRTAPSPPTPRGRPPTRLTAPPLRMTGRRRGTPTPPPQTAPVKGTKTTGTPPQTPLPTPPTRTLAASRRTPAMTRDKTTPPTGRIPPQTPACPRRKPSPSSSPTWPSRGGPWS